MTRRMRDPEVRSCGDELAAIEPMGVAGRRAEIRKERHNARQEGFVQVGTQSPAMIG